MTYTHDGSNPGPGSAPNPLTRADVARRAETYTIFHQDQIEGEWRDIAEVEIEAGGVADGYIWTTVNSTTLGSDFNGIWHLFAGPLAGGFFWCGANPDNRLRVETKR